MLLLAALCLAGLHLTAAFNQFGPLPNNLHGMPWHDRVPGLLQPLNKNSDSQVEATGNIDTAADEATAVRHWPRCQGRPCIKHEKIPIPILLPDLPFEFPGRPVNEVEIGAIDNYHITLAVRFPFSPASVIVKEVCQRDYALQCQDQAIPVTATEIFGSECLGRNEKTLSGECRAMIGHYRVGAEQLQTAAVLFVEASCEDDRQQYCPSAPGSTHPWQLFTSPCMIKNHSHLSEKCRRVFEAFVPVGQSAPTTPWAFAHEVHIENITLPIAPGAAVSSDRQGANEAEEVNETTNAQSTAQNEVPTTPTGSFMFWNPAGPPPFIIGPVLFLATIVSLFGLAHLRNAQRGTEEAYKMAHFLYRA